MNNRKIEKRKDGAFTVYLSVPLDSVDYEVEAARLLAKKGWEFVEIVSQRQCSAKIADVRVLARKREVTS